MICGAAERHVVRLQALAFHMRIVMVLTLCSALPLARLEPQTAADTAAIESALLAVVVRQLQSGGDYAPPLRVPIRTDSSWSGRLHAQLRARYPDLVELDSADTPSVRRPGLTLHVSVLSLQRTVGEARIVWTRCTTRAALLNYWTHDSYVKLRKAITSWLVDRPHVLGGSDGHC